MAYPDDQAGIPLPHFPGWRPLDWFNEGPLKGDRVTAINSHTKELDGGPAGSVFLYDYHPVTCDRIYGGNAATGKTHVIYRKVEPEFIILDNPDTTLMDGDIIAKTSISPAALGELKPRFAGYYGWGYLMCAREGYGSGSYKVGQAQKEFKGCVIYRRSNVHPAPAATQVPRRRRTPESNAFSKPLPLP